MALDQNMSPCKVDPLILAFSHGIVKNNNNWYSKKWYVFKKNKKEKSEKKLFYLKQLISHPLNFLFSRIFTLIDFSVLLFLTLL